MSATRGVTSLEDIYYDLEGADKLAGQLTRFSSEGAAPRRTRDLDVRAAPAGPPPRSDGPGKAAGAVTGARLVALQPPDLQTRYQTLFWLEAQFPPQHDFGYLIGPACQILETELNQLLTSPARDLADRLVAALGREKKNRKQADILAEWAAGKVPCTIGITCLVLLALRRGLGQGDAAVGQFLDANFRAAYRPLLAGNHLGPALDRVREHYRNPACHGLRTFDAPAYEAFARLAVANRSFVAWRGQGPLPTEPPGRSGVLHYHLQESRRLAEEAAARPDPVARLLSLAAPRQSPWTVHLRPEPAAGPHTTRDIGVTPARMERPFRLGDAVRFAFQAGRDCGLALIDVGTSGAVAVVLPNAWRPEARVAAGRTYHLPGPDFPEFEYTLAGLPGRERAVAVAWAGDPPVPLRPEGGKPFRALTPAEIDALVAALQKADPGAWAACACEWEVCEKPPGP